MSLYNIMIMTYTVILCPKCSAATHELTYRRNVNYKDEPFKPRAGVEVRIVGFYNQKKMEKKKGKG